MGIKVFEVGNTSPSTLDSIYLLMPQQHFQDHQEHCFLGYVIFSDHDFQIQIFFLWLIFFNLFLLQWGRVLNGHQSFQRTSFNKWQKYYQLGLCIQWQKAALYVLKLLCLLFLSNKHNLQVMPPSVCETTDLFSSIVLKK